MDEKQCRKDNGLCYNPDGFIAIFASKDDRRIRDEGEAYSVNGTSGRGVLRNEKKERQATRHRVIKADTN